MADLDLVVRAQRVITAAGEAGRAILVGSGRVLGVQPYDTQFPAAARVLDVPADCVVLPGLVDSHVHVNEPGRTEWEGFATATRAAAAGGVTTIVDMPLNSIPPTVDVAALEAKRAAAADQAFVDVAFWGGAVPGSLAELRSLHEAGVAGFKCFLPPSGVEEFPPLTLEQVAEAMALLRTFDGLLVVHAEDPDLLEAAPGTSGPSYAAFLASRPAAAENTAVAHVIDLAARTGARAHVVHLSSAEAIPLFAAAQRDGVRITTETCPHYLTLSAEEVPDGATQFKCCPPIRDRANQELLWDGLRAGTIGVVVSDHSPCPVELKALDVGDFATAWGGIASLQLGLPVLWTAARARGLELVDVVRWMARAAADLAGLPTKGRIEIGADADFCVFAPDEPFVVDAARLHHRNKLTPYDGQHLTGVVRSTWLRGVEVTGDAPTGRLLRRGSTH